MLKLHSFLRTLIFVILLFPILVMYYLTKFRSDLDNLVIRLPICLLYCFYLS